MNPTGEDRSFVLATFTVTCPACHGKETRLFERSSGPGVATRCPECRGNKVIEVFWASSSQLPGVRHAVRAAGAPPVCLCGWTIPVRQLTQPQGLVCAGCLRSAPQLDIPRGA